MGRLLEGVCRSPAKLAARAGASFKVTSALTRWGAAFPYASTRRELKLNTTKTCENFDVLITLPGHGAALKGKPRVTPRIFKRKGADIANNTLLCVLFCV